jgi:site-specific DNA-methyltransferase (adenine-specific)
MRDPAAITHEVVLADCLGPEGLATLPDKSVDHVICDPPYSPHTHEKQRTQGMPKAANGSACASRREPGGARYRDLGFGAITPREAMRAAEQFARVVRRWVLVFTDAEGLALWRWALVRSELEHVRVGAWVKPGAPPQFTGDRPAVGFEAIEIAHPAGRKSWNGGGKAAVWEFPIEPGGPRRLHTTQKPLALMERLVADFTDPGDLILDAFAGSGTTGVAAKRLGRRFIGWERDPKYHAIAEKRIASAREQRQLFAERGPEPVQVPLLGGSR